MLAPHSLVLLSLIRQHPHPVSDRLFPKPPQNQSNLPTYSLLSCGIEFLQEQYFVLTQKQLSPFPFSTDLKDP
jgi:hypothetical protein